MEKKKKNASQKCVEMTEIQPWFQSQSSGLGNSLELDDEWEGKLNKMAL